MKIKNHNHEAVSAIAMTVHGINAYALSPQSELDSIRRTLLTLPDSAWGEGLGKQHLQQQLHVQLKKENEYFLNNPRQVNYDSERWTEFMDDCIFYAVLHSVVTGSPIILVHPDQWSQFRSSSKRDASSGIGPSLIPDLPVKRVS